MKTIGLIGGMSWESSAIYYQTINREVARRLGGLHSAKLLLHSVDFAEIAAMQRADDWDGAARTLAAIAQSLEHSGADCALICTNTMHKIAPQVQAAINIPLIHIADAATAAIQAAGFTRVGLLGTRFTMEQPFLIDRYAARGVTCLTPDADSRHETHRIIFDELCQGRVTAPSKQAIRAICDQLTAAGAQGIVLGCTELTMIVKPDDLTQPVFDTTALHAQAAVDFALQG